MMEYGIIASILIGRQSMKKPFIKFFLASLLATCSVGLIADEQSEKNLIQSVEESYKKGSYDKFLKAVDEEYRKAGKSGLLRTVFHQMKKWNTSNESLLKESLLGIEQADQAIIAQRDAQLTAICNEDANGEICKKVDAILHPKISDKQREALKFMSSLKSKAPQDNLNTPENKLASIEAEYDLKLSLLQLALLRKNDKNPLDIKKRMALTFDKFKKMEEAASSFADPKWKTLVQDARSAFEESYESRAQFAYLKDLAAGKVASKTPQEEKVKSVMKDFLEKKDELNQKILKNLK